MGKRRAPGRVCHSAGRVTTKLLCSFLATAFTTTAASASWADNWIGRVDQVPVLPISAHPQPDSQGIPLPPRQDHDFTLRHIFHHGLYEYPDLHKRLDVRPEHVIWTAAEGEAGRERAGILHARSRHIPIQRLSDRRLPILQSLISTARLTGLPPAIMPSAWTIDEVPSPNVTDKETVVSLSLMAANAYTENPNTGEWEDVSAGFNHSDSFGWEKDGLRGHIFADEGNQTIVVAIKGTTPAVFDGAGSTTKDKINDNLFFSCCCAQGGHYLWKQVCDCSSSAFTCNSTCLVKALRRENRYYQAATELYGNVTELYPHSNIWLTGHSLGGSVSSMLGLTFGLPATTFEAPGEARAAARLGLPVPPDTHPSAPQTRSYTGAYHFGHTADPIFMGTCNSATSGCTLGGYAMETQCHTGNVCIYDTVKDKNWRVSISWHSIRSVIKDVFRAYDTVADCVQDTECVDCYNWNYFESNSSESTTTTTTTTSPSIPTRTTTCQTPGWWGCRDETSTTTTPVSTILSTVTSTTATCKVYGWFGGCLDSSTTTITSTITSTTALVSKILSTVTLTTATCKEYGWFGGCLDSSTTTITSTITSTTAVPADTTTGEAIATSNENVTPTPTCQHYGWFGQCKDPQPKQYGVLVTPRATATATT
ncbi:MAG: hypothetical protein L6R40_000741 [Gallowayella cf. fulva]|nr:MAG: hypothetical protein L6R40_000741 [Xanthomendoza cf. fulva]